MTMADTRTSEKRQDASRLEATRRAGERQREWFASFRRRVMESGEPYVIAGAVAPHEIFHAMDVPVVATPWYSAVIAAKQLSPQYFGLMDQLGYHAHLPRYESLPLMSTLANDPATAPYGGLPKPGLLLDRLRGESAQRVYGQWGKAFGGVPVFSLDNSSQTRLEPDWFKYNQHDWERLYESHRLDFQVAQLKNLIRIGEMVTHRSLDHSKFVEQMHRINAAGEIVAEVRDVLAAARPYPVPLTEQLTNVMAATWHRGSQWSVDHLNLYRSEVQRLIDQGAAVCRDERVRLLWGGNGLWFNTAFYRAFEAKHGAVFVWSMYTNFFSDGYRKYFSDDPLRALAARHVTMNELLHAPPWMADWIIHQARAFGAHGAVMLVPIGDRLAAYGSKFASLALERAGIPVLQLSASAVDARLWDNDKMTRLVEEFIEQRILKK
jgi:benzoyl-CoA reductase subunit B